MHALLVGMQPQTGNALMFLEAEATYDAAATGADALPLVGYVRYDLFLLAVHLPDMDAWQLIERWRAAGLDTPIIAFTGQPRASETIKVLNAGADDVISWPIDTAELRARAQAIRRRIRPLHRNVIRLGALAIDAGQMTASLGDSPIPLTGKELEILCVLAERRGKCATRESIYNRLYCGADGPERQVIDVLVCRIRRKLEAAGARGYLRTTYGEGYSLHAPPLAKAPERVSLTPLQCETA